MSEVRLGRQTPTVSIRLPYTDSLGSEAVALYNKSDRTAQDWQALMLEDIMATNSDGLWTHMKFGWSIPRRNGKSEILIMRAMYAVTHGCRALYTTHRRAVPASNVTPTLFRFMLFYELSPQGEGCSCRTVYFLCHLFH